MCRAGCVFILLVLSTPGTAADVVTILWDGVAPSIRVNVGIERVIKFDHNKIQVGIPIEHSGIASAESNNGVVYLRCAAPFEKTRYRFREKDTGKIFMMDVTCSSGSDSLPPIVLTSPVTDPLYVSGDEVELATPPVEGGENPAASIDAPMAVAPVVVPVQYGVTTLVRYAMQEVYAPQRLVDHKKDIQKISFDDQSSSLSMVPGVEVRSRILGHWKNEGLYITAIYLQNMTNEIVDLDPRYLSGRHTWKASALMNDQLSPANTFGDATTLVTVSTNRWTEDSKWLR